MNTDNNSRPNILTPMPLVKGDTFSDIQKALELTLEHGVSVEGFSHQKFVVAAQNANGKTMWANFVKQGYLKHANIVWAFIPRGKKKVTAGRQTYLVPKRSYVGVMVDFRAFKPETKPYFIDLTSQENKQFFTRLGHAFALYLEEIEAVAKEIEEEMHQMRLKSETDRCLHVDPRFLPEMIEDGNVEEA